MINSLNTTLILYAITLLLGFNNITIAMMLSTNPKFKNKNTINKNTIKKNTINKNTIIEQNPNFATCLNLSTDATNEICKYLSFQDKLSLRLVSKGCAIDNKLPQILYDRYNNNRYTSFPCAFLDLINRHAIQKIRLLLQNNNKPLPFLSYTDFRNQWAFICLHPLGIIQNEHSTKSTKEISILLQKYPNENHIASNKKYLQPNYKLCLASCVGNIQAFKNEYSKTINTNDENQKEINQRSIPLVIWIATQNCDINFLKHLLQYDEYKKYIHNHSDKFLTLICTGPLKQNYNSLEDQPTVTKTQFEKIKCLIDSNIFNLFQKNNDQFMLPEFMAVDCIRFFYSRIQPQNTYLENIYQYISTKHQQNNIQEIEKNLRSNNMLEWILSYLPWNYTKEKINFWKKLQKKFYDTPYLLNNLTTKDQQEQWLKTIQRSLEELVSTYHKNITVDKAKIIEKNYHIISEAFNGLPYDLRTQIETNIHTSLLDIFFNENYSSKMQYYCYLDRSSLH